MLWKVINSKVEKVFQKCMQSYDFGRFRVNDTPEKSLASVQSIMNEDLL